MADINLYTVNVFQVPDEEVASEDNNGNDDKLLNLLRGAKLIDKYINMISARIIEVSCSNMALGQSIAL